MMRVVSLVFWTIVAGVFVLVSEPVLVLLTGRGYEDRHPRDHIWDDFKDDPGVDIDE
jgi:hypothetical protein